MLSYMQAWQSTCLVQNDFSNDCSIATFRTASLQRWGADALRVAATSEEVRPLPEDVAKSLGANLYFTRLAGHGRGDLPMSEPSMNDWMQLVLYRVSTMHWLSAFMSVRSERISCRHVELYGRSATS